MVGALATNSTFKLKDGETTCMLTNCKIYDRPSFVDYLRSGWAISLVTAIDYTASNGDQRQSNSLHALGRGNEYLQALQSVGSIVEPYDADRSFPVFGFGALPPGTSSVSHCFPLNGNPMNPEIQGIENIVACYKQTLPSIRLAGPTFFAPLLTQFKEYTKSVA